MIWYSVFFVQGNYSDKKKSEVLLPVKVLCHKRQLEVKPEFIKNVCNVNGYQGTPTSKELDYFFSHSSLYLNLKNPQDPI